MAAGTDLASSLTTLAINAADRISLNISRSLLLAAPSVPSPTFIPCLTNLATGQNPLANFIFDSGQCNIFAPCSAIDSISFSCNWVAWMQLSRVDSRPNSCNRCRGRRPSLAIASDISCAVSCRWIWIGRSSSSARTLSFCNGASETV